MNADDGIFIAPRIWVLFVTGGKERGREKETLSGASLMRRTRLI